MTTYSITISNWIELIRNIRLLRKVSGIRYAVNKNQKGDLKLSFTHQKMRSNGVARLTREGISLTSGDCKMIYTRSGKTYVLWWTPLSRQ